MFFDDDDELDLYKDDYNDDNSNNRGYNDYSSNERSNSHIAGSVIGVAKEFIDESTKDIVNEKIRDVVEDMASSIDSPKLGKSLVIGSVAGILITIALYKILK